MKLLSDEEIQQCYDNHPYLWRYVCNLLSETLRKEGLSRDVAGEVTGKHDKATPKGNNTHLNTNNNMIKSPSDTTLYRPAMRLSSDKKSAVVNQILNFIAVIQMQYEQ